MENQTDIAKPSSSNEIDSILERIRAAIKAEGARPLAIRSGLSKNALYGHQRDDWNPSASTMRAVISLQQDH